ncbi:endogenous retrovirus group K member 6 Gag polyprotein-like, partial [Calypte anna]|uniref:endogenous retrovirus group K member 6 Gag polyprotein-like n=1 Tax=Calypte anna TaxID=9244 RepID=UPI0011C42821
MLLREVRDLLNELHEKEAQKNMKGVEATWKMVISSLEEIKREVRITITAIDEAPKNGSLVKTPPPVIEDAVVPSAPPLPTETEETKKAFPILTTNSFAVKGMRGKIHHTVAEFLSDFERQKEKASGSANPSISERETPNPGSKGNEATTIPSTTPVGPESSIKALLEQTAQTIKSLEKRISNLEQRTPFQTYREPPPILDDDEETTPTPILPKQSSQGTPTSQPGRWSGIIRDAIIEGGWEPSNKAFPIIYDNNGPPSYEQHGWKTLQQAKKTLREEGLRSESGQAILDWLFTADTNCPLDCQNLARYLLTPSQQIVWIKEWERLAHMEAIRPRIAGDLLTGITGEMLTGAGQYADMQIQLQFPPPIHHAAARLARQAFNVVPEPTPLPSFTAVKQGVNEPFQHFVDRLWQAITAQSELGAEQRDAMFKLLAFDNANPRMKSLFSTLPKTAGVSDMLEVAARATQNQQHQGMASAFAAALEPTQKLLAAVAQRLGEQRQFTRKKNNQRNPTNNRRNPASPADVAEYRGTPQRDARPRSGATDAKRTPTALNRAGRQKTGAAARRAPAPGHKWQGQRSTTTLRSCHKREPL